MRQLRRLQFGSMVTNLPIFTAADMPEGEVLLSSSGGIKLGQGGMRNAQIGVPRLLE